MTNQPFLFANPLNCLLSPEFASLYDVRSENGGGVTCSIGIMNEDTAADFQGAMDKYEYGCEVGEEIYGGQSRTDHEEPECVTAERC